jgi:hypothetical protein
VGSTSAARTVTIKNHLNRTLNITAIGFTGADPGDFVPAGTTCGSTLSAGISCTFSAAFRPVAKGSRTASLTVSDDANPNSQSIDLAGTGK